MPRHVNLFQARKCHEKATRMTSLDLSIIIVNYNTADFVLHCIASIHSTVPADVHYEVIVVDNGSSDGSLELLVGCPSVRLIAAPRNLGFSTANNLGVANMRSRYVLFLNPDTVVGSQTLLTLINFMDSHPSAGAATCRVELPDASIDDSSHRGFPTPWNAFCYFSGLAQLFPHSRLFAGYTAGWQDMSRVHTVDALAGCFMLVRREAGDEVGWWDEDYFFYGEDLDFCFKLAADKWEIYYVPSVSILHYKGASAGIKRESTTRARPSPETRVRASAARFDAMRIFYRKHYLTRYPPIVTHAVLLGIGLKQRLAERQIQGLDRGVAER